MSLPIPPVLSPTRSDSAADSYEIIQREAAVEIVSGMRTRIWGYNGIFPGPTIEARRGRTIVVTHTNRLERPTVVHLHGGITRPESDGFPTDSLRARHAHFGTTTPASRRRSGITITAGRVRDEIFTWALLVCIS
jgi:FtsP/CotA-like multicopper oxidase with cupredoxin domain